MGGVLLLIGIIYVIYKVFEEASVPKQTGKFDWDRYNSTVNGKGYSQKQINKMIDSGMFHDK